MLACVASTVSIYLNKIEKSIALAVSKTQHRNIFDLPLNSEDKIVRNLASMGLARLVVINEICKISRKKSDFKKSSEASFKIL